MNVVGLVAVYRPEDQGVELLRRLYACKGCRWILFENSPHGTRKCPGIEIVPAQRNGGTAAMVHWAQRLVAVDTSIEAVWLLDQDTQFTSKDLLDLTDFLQSNPRVSGGVPLLSTAHGTLDVSIASDGEWSPRPHTVADVGKSLSAAALSGTLLRASALRSLKLPPIDLHLDWFDYTLAEALLQTSSPLVSAATVRLAHVLGKLPVPRTWRGRTVCAPIYPAWRIRAAASNRSWLELRRRGSAGARLRRVKRQLTDAFWAAHYLATDSRADTLQAAAAALEGTLHGLLTAWLAVPAPYEGSPHGDAPGREGWSRSIV